MDLYSVRSPGWIAYSNWGGYQPTWGRVARGEWDWLGFTHLAGIKALIRRHDCKGGGRMGGCMKVVPDVPISFSQQPGPFVGWRKSGIHECS